jgi:hypothetical protein
MDIKYSNTRGKKDLNIEIEKGNEEKMILETSDENY